jgi:hypothetical protein
MKTGRFAVPALLIMRAFLLSTFALQCQDFPIQQVASSVISFALEHVSVQAAGYLPSAEDINYQMIRSVASTLTHITVDSSKRGRITVFTVSRVILPVTELSKLAFAKALRKVHRVIVDKRTFERLRELVSGSRRVQRASGSTTTTSDLQGRWPKWSSRGGERSRKLS